MRTSRLDEEAIAIYIYIRLEAIAIRLEGIAIGLEIVRVVLVSVPAKAQSISACTCHLCSAPAKLTVTVAQTIQVHKPKNPSSSMARALMIVAQYSASQVT